MRHSSITALAATIALCTPGAALAAPNVVHSSAFTYVPDPVTIGAGESLTHTTADRAPHNVRSVQRDEQNRPLFSSGPPILAGAAEVEGVSDLAPGSYEFLCTVHPFMRGTLAVEDRDLPQPPQPATGVAAPVAAVPTPTSVAVHGSALYAASYGGGNVTRFQILPGGVLGPGSVYADGFRSPLGVAFAPDGTMFVSDSHPSADPERETDGRVWAVAPDGSRDVVVDRLPNGRHNTNGMAVKDGRLYIANGNSTDDGVAGGDPEVPPYSGSLLSVPAGARGLTVDSPEVVVEATGMRNLYDVAFRPGTNEAWIPTNGPDFLDPLGEDTLNRVDDVTGPPVHFGFPECLYAANPTRAEENAGVGTCGPHEPPERLLGLHVSADGLDFGPQDAFWGGDLFVARFGNFFGKQVVGHDVIRVPIDAAGSAGEPQVFLPDALPLDLVFGPPRNRHVRRGLRNGTDHAGEGAVGQGRREPRRVDPGSGRPSGSRKRMRARGAAATIERVEREGAGVMNAATVDCHARGFECKLAEIADTVDRSPAS